MPAENKLLLIILVSLLTIFTSCDVVNQAAQMNNLAKCDFRLESVQHLNLSGINVQNVKGINDLSFFDAGILASAVASQKLPLDFVLNMEARNPNSSAAGMNRMEWILLIDNIEMAQGILEKPVTIPANSSSLIIPMQMHVDLWEILSGKNADTILTFGLNLSGTGNKPTRFTLKVKPSLTISGIPVNYPGYLTVNTEYAANQ